MADDPYDADGDVSRFLDELTMETSMETLLKAPTVTAEPQMDQATFVQPQAPVMQVQYQQPLEESATYDPHDQVVIQAPGCVEHFPGGSSSGDGLHDQGGMPAPDGFYEEFLGEPSAYGLHDQVVMPAPDGLYEEFLGEPSAYGLHDQVVMPALDECHENFLGEPSTYHGIHDQMMMPAPGCEEHLIGETSAYGLHDQMPMQVCEGQFVGIDEALMSVQEDYAGDSASGIPELALPAEDEEDFVTLMPGQLQCGDCHVIRELRYQSVNREVYLCVHGTANGTFEHAILDFKYTGADGQIPRTEQMYINLRRRTHEWAHNFIASCVETLRNDTSGTLEDTCDTTIGIDAPPVNDPYMQLEIGMLQIILNPTISENLAPPPPPPAEQPALAGQATENTNLFHQQLPKVLESSNVAEKEQSSSANATVNPSLVTRKKDTVAIVGTEEQKTLQYLHDLKEKAEREQNMPCPIVKKFCRNNRDYSWMLRLINSQNKKIIKLEKDAFKFGMSGLMKLRCKMDECVAGKENLYAEILKGIKKEAESKGDDRVGKYNDEAGPSGINQEDI